MAVTTTRLDGHDTEDALMKNTDLKRLADVVMGEAVVTLLSKEDSIIAASLARQLRAMERGDNPGEARSHSSGAGRCAGGVYLVPWKPLRSRARVRYPHAPG